LRFLPLALYIAVVEFAENGFKLDVEVPAHLFEVLVKRDNFVRAISLPLDLIAPKV